MQLHLLGHRPRYHNAVGREHSAQVALDGAEPEQVDNRLGDIIENELETVRLIPFFLHVEQSVGRHPAAELDFGALLDDRREHIGRRVDDIRIAIEMGHDRIQAIGFGERAIVTQIVCHLRHHHIESRESQREARDVERRGGFVAAQGGKEILESYLHKSEIRASVFKQQYVVVAEVVVRRGYDLLARLQPLGDFVILRILAADADIAAIGHRSTRRLSTGRTIRGG